MTLFTRKCRLVLTFALVLVAGRLQAASIVGDTVEIWGVAQVNGDEYLKDTVQVVDPGVEYTETISNDIYELNVGPASITLISLAEWYSPWFNSGFPATTIEVRDIDVPGMPGLSIGGVSVIYSDTIFPDDSAPVNYPAFSAANVTFTPHSVILESGGYRFPSGSRVEIDLTFVPEPGTLVLFATAALVVPLVGWRRARRVRR